MRAESRRRSITIVINVSDDVTKCEAINKFNNWHRAPPSTLKDSAISAANPRTYFEENGRQMRKWNLMQIIITFQFNYATWNRRNFRSARDDDEGEGAQKKHENF